MTSTANFIQRIERNPLAFYRLGKIKKRIGYMDMGVNHFNYIMKDKRGNGFMVSVFKQPLKPFSVTINDIKKHNILYQSI